MKRVSIILGVLLGSALLIVFGSASLIGYVCGIIYIAESYRRRKVGPERKRY